MRALFDVNLLIAILDGEHVHHRRAHEWWAAHHTSGWASCPLTQNGFVRIISQPNYSNPVSSAFALDLLAEQMSGTDHAFWPDDISILETERFNRSKILGPNQLTDVYLLALAVRNEGRLVTLDGAVPLGPVRGAEPRHLVVI